MPVTSSGIILLSDPAKVAHQMTKNALDLYPHARAFMPGQPDHFSHPKVGGLNKMFGSLNDNNKEKVFAVWHDPNQAIQPSGLFGVVVWHTDVHNPEWALPIGNPASVPVEGNKRLVEGIVDVPKILQRLSLLVELSRATSDKALALFDELTGKKRNEQINAEKMAEQRQAITEGVLEAHTLTRPSRSDRTISIEGGAVGVDSEKVKVRLKTAEKIQKIRKENRT